MSQGFSVKLKMSPHFKAMLKSNNIEHESVGCYWGAGVEEIDIVNSSDMDKARAILDNVKLCYLED